MKLDRNAVIGLAIFAILLATPIFLGRIPSMPRKSGLGWTPTISLHEEPRKFWTYVAVEASVLLVIFFVSRLALARGPNERR